LQLESSRIGSGDGKKIRDALYEFKQKVRSKNIPTKGEAFDYFHSYGLGSIKDALFTRVEILLRLMKRILRTGAVNNA
ncbi:MAG: hypothetical protein M1587_07400, partial [Thaumarchaeota archaeon]|nr:hypothetical protein [Nitrososphaerota archaeon]